MYNRYAPQDGFQPVEPCAEEQHRSSDGKKHAPLHSLLEYLNGSKNAGGLTGILKSWKLDSLDRGDLLLLFLILYLFWESDDTELLIILALLFLPGL